MRYFVIGDDGQKYGPADVATLNDWISQQRLLPTQQLEEEASGTRMAASSVPGLNFPLQSAPGQQAGGYAPPGGSPYAGGQPLQGNYYRPGAFADDGSKDVFVHISAVERSGIGSLRDGQKVSYDVIQDRGKPAATNLKAG